MRLRSAASLTAAIALMATCLGGTPRSGSAQTGEPVRVEWQSQDTGTGQALISGYVYNQNLMKIQRVQLRVQPASGPGGARTVYLTGTIPSHGREYFEVKMPAGQAPFQVTVTIYDWSQCGNG